jgi:hypothetical protein
MFGVNLDCGLKSVKVQTKKIDGRTVRRCRVVLAHEFTTELADALGKEAKEARKGLRSGALEDVTLKISALACLGVFTADGQKTTIQRMVGVKAKGIANDNEDNGPSLLLEFEFQWQPDAWLFFGTYCGVMAEVVLTKRQLTLANDGTNN